MTLSVGFRITVSLLILLPKLRGSDYYPGGTNSHRTRQPSLDAHRQLQRSQIPWAAFLKRRRVTGPFSFSEVMILSAGEIDG